VADLTYIRASASRRTAKIAFTRDEWRRLGGLYAVIALLHLTGWGLYLHYAGDHPALVGLGFTAYMLGLRHAFDADHIAAIDDTVRFMLQRGERPLGIGFFFSLGHSTIVLALAVGVAFAATAVRDHLPAWKDVGGLVGAGVSGTFLWIIGIVNLLVLLDILGVWRSARKGSHDHAHLEVLLRKRGLLTRLCGPHVERLLTKSWQMYPLGVLFGLGFDTASEVGLLALTAGASAGNLPLAGVVAMPILFAAGMSLMDTSDGVLMAKAYDWAFLNPLRKIFYNVTTTSLSVVVALVIGTIELWQVLIALLHLRGPVADAVAGLDFGMLGYVIVGLFLFGWGLSVALWKFGRLERRELASVALHRHPHAHGGASPHVHHHVH
jgi:high-affinity nickel-transport protein